jgi:hypothetical protein
LAVQFHTKAHAKKSLERLIRRFIGELAGIQLIIYGSLKFLLEVLGRADFKGY